jgi:hypothetical protein
MLNTFWDAASGFFIAWSEQGRFTRVKKIFVLVLTVMVVATCTTTTSENELPESLSQLIPMPQLITLKGTHLQGHTSRDPLDTGITITGGVLVCLFGEEFQKDSKDGRLMRALKREIGQRVAGGDILEFASSDPSAERTCMAEASRREMTPVLLEQQASSHGFSEARWRSSDAYLLHSSISHIRISSFGEVGAFRAIQTLMQICLHDNFSDDPNKNDSCDIPSVEIRDWSDLPNRGVMLDVSRNRVHTLETLYLLVDTLAALKFNQLQMYTEHTFAYTAHPTVWNDSGAITKEQAQALSLSLSCHERSFQPPLSLY